MTELTNPWWQHGDEGTKPPNGLDKSGGDQYEAAYFDYQADNQYKQTQEKNTAIRRRVSDLDGDRLLDGCVVTKTSQRSLTVTESTGAYVSGQFTFAIDSKNITVPRNDSGTDRTDVVYLTVDGSVALKTGVTEAPSNSMVLAYTTITTNDVITNVDSVGRRITTHGSATARPYDSDSVGGDTLHHRGGNSSSHATDDTYEVYDGRDWEPLLFADGRQQRTDDQDYGGNALHNVSNLTDDAENTIYENNHINQSALEDDSLSVNSGSYLDGGGEVSLGGSTTLDVDYSKLKNDLGVTNDGSVTINSGSYLDGGGTVHHGESTTLSVDYSSLKNALDDDIGGSDGYTGPTSLSVNSGSYLDGGGEVSLGGSTTLDVDYTALRASLSDDIAGYTGPEYVTVDAGSYLDGGGRIGFGTSERISLDMSSVKNNLDNRYVNESGDTWHGDMDANKNDITDANFISGDSGSINYDGIDGHGEDSLTLRPSSSGSVAINIDTGNNPAFAVGRSGRRPVSFYKKVGFDDSVMMNQGNGNTSRNLQFDTGSSIISVDGYDGALRILNGGLMLDKQTGSDSVPIRSLFVNRNDRLVFKDSSGDTHGITN